MDHAIRKQDVAVEQRLDPGLVRELVRAPGHLIKRLVVIVVHVVR